METEGENAFVMNGGTPLKGVVHLSGAKNVALKILIAALLCNKKAVFHNIPQLRDIRELVSLLESIGVKIETSGGAVEVDSGALKTHKVDLLYGSRIRTSFMLFAPFIFRFGKAEIPNPGGCRIGARPIDRQIDLMEAFGVTTQYDSSTGYYSAHLRNASLNAAEYTFTKKTHTGTELALMFAVIAQGNSVIRNAAREPEIDSLIDFFNVCGAHIQRKEDALFVEGVKELTPPSEPFSIQLDRNEAVTYAVFAYATKGDILVSGANPSHLKTFLQHLEKIGAKYDVGPEGIRFYHAGSLHASDITTAPEPGFMTDWQAPWAVLMTQAQGTSTIHETVFENRFGYVDELKKLGASIEFYEPSVHNPEEVYQFDFKTKIRIDGPRALHGGVMNVTDMRAGATLLIGAAAAQGESVIVGAAEIDRGYQHIEVKLASLGARITRI